MCEYRRRSSENRFVIASFVFLRVPFLFSNFESTFFFMNSMNAFIRSFVRVKLYVLFKIFIEIHKKYVFFCTYLFFIYIKMLYDTAVAFRLYRWQWIVVQKLIYSIKIIHQFREYKKKRIKTLQGNSNSSKLPIRNQLGRQ